MVDEELTEIVGRIIGLTDNRGKKVPKYEMNFLADVQNEKKQHGIHVTYSTYNPSLWESIRNLEHEAYKRRLLATIRIRGEIEETKIEYEGVGLITIQR